MPVAPFPPFRRLPWLKASLLVAGLGILSGCGAIQPGTPGHEPPTAGRYNPVSGEVNQGGR